MSRILRSSRVKSSPLVVPGLKTPSLVSPLNRPHLIRKSHAYSRPSHCVLHIHLGQMMKVCRRQRSNLTAIMLLSQTKRLVSLRPTLKSLTRRDHEMLGIGMALLHRLLVRRLLNMAPMSRRRRSFKLRLMPCERNLRRKMRQRTMTFSMAQLRTTLFKTGFLKTALLKTNFNLNLNLNRLSNRPRRP